MLSRKIRMSLQRPAGSSQAALVSGNCWFMRSPPCPPFSSSPPLPTPPFSSLILRIFWKNSHNPLFTFAAESNLSKVKAFSYPRIQNAKKTLQNRQKTFPSKLIALQICCWKIGIIWIIRWWISLSDDVFCHFVFGWNVKYTLRLLIFAVIFFVGCAVMVCWYKLNIFRLLYDALGCVDCWITNDGGDHLPAVVGILNNLGVNDIFIIQPLNIKYRKYAKCSGAGIYF